MKGSRYSFALTHSNPVVIHIDFQFLISILAVALNKALKYIATLTFALPKAAWWHNLPVSGPRILYITASLLQIWGRIYTICTIGTHYA